MGIAALILGIMSVLTCWIPFTFGGVGIFFGLVAVILGALGRRKLLEEGRGAGVAIGGLITGILGLVVGLAHLASCIACWVCAATAEPPPHSSTDWDSTFNNMNTNLGTNNNTGTVATPPPPSAPQPITVGTPASGTFGTNLPTDPQGYPYIDYTLVVAAQGNYRIDLIATGIGYDPYLRLIQNGTELVTDDDGGEGLNSRITHSLAPGTYTIRASKFAASQNTSAVNYTLTVVQAP